MPKAATTLRRVLSGTADANLRFDELRQLLLDLGFSLRVKGDHYIFTRDDLVEIINLQPRGGMAKAYQVRQIRGILVKYRLGGGTE